MPLALLSKIRTWKYVQWQNAEDISLELLLGQKSFVTLTIPGCIIDPLQPVLFSLIW